MTQAKQSGTPQKRHKNDNRPDSSPQTLKIKSIWRLLAPDELHRKYEEGGRIHTALCLWIALSWIFFTSCCAHASEAFTVRNVPVDVQAASAEQARAQALINGQRAAFKLITERFLKEEDTKNLPPLTDDQLEALILDFEVTEEKNSDVRYKGKLTFRFHPERVNAYFAQNQTKTLEAPLHGKSAVIVPVYLSQKGRIFLWEDHNPWRQAWNEQEALDPKYILPMGDLKDRLLSPQDVLDGNSVSFSKLRDTYQAETIVVVVLKEEIPFKMDLFIYDAKGLSYLEENIDLLGEPVFSSVLAHQGIKKTLEKLTLFQHTHQGRSDALAPSVLGARYRIVFDDYSQWLQIKKKLEAFRWVRNLTVHSLTGQQALVTLGSVSPGHFMKKDLEKEGFLVSPDPEKQRQEVLMWRRSPDFGTSFSRPASPSSPPSLAQKHLP